MSQYMSFYLKSNKHDFLPVKTFCRASSVYEAMTSQAVYGKNIPMTHLMCETIIKELTEKLQKYNESIAIFEEKIATIGTWKNSLEEKVEYLDDYAYSIAEYKEEIASVEKAKQFFLFLEDIIEEAEDTAYIDDPGWVFSPETYVWIGWEASMPAGESGNDNDNEEN